MIVINITVYSQEDDDCNGFSDISDYKAPDVTSDEPPDAADDVTTAGACGAGVETPSTKGFDIDGVTILPVFVDSLHRRYDTGISLYILTTIPLQKSRIVAFINIYIVYNIPLQKTNGIPLITIEYHSVSFSTIGAFNYISAGLSGTLNDNLKYHSMLFFVRIYHEAYCHFEALTVLFRVIMLQLYT